MHRRYTPILRAPHRLDSERSATQSTFDSSRIAIAPLNASSRPCETFLRRPRVRSNGAPKICQTKTCSNPENFRCAPSATIIVAPARHCHRRAPSATAIVAPERHCHRRASSATAIAALVARPHRRRPLVLRAYVSVSVCAKRSPRRGTVPDSGSAPDVLGNFRKHGERCGGVVDAYSTVRPRRERPVFDAPADLTLLRPDSFNQPKHF